MIGYICHKGTAFLRHVQINLRKSFGFVDYTTKMVCFGGNQAVVKENLIT